MDEILMTQESYDKLLSELDDIKKVKMPSIVKRIEEAIKLGDLSENAEYHGAKDDQGWAAAKVRELELKIEQAKIIQRTDGKIVDIGSRLELVDNEGRERAVEIVDQVTSDPLSGKISNESPLGSVLIGRKEGDKIEVQLPSGPKMYEIKKVY